MEQALLEFGLKDGIFGAMFVWLLVYVLKTSKQREDRAEVREEKMYSFLDEMKLQFAKLVGSYEKLSGDVSEIKQDIDKIKDKKVDGKYDKANS